MPNFGNAYTYKYIEKKRKKSADWTLKWISRNMPLVRNERAQVEPESRKREKRIFKWFSRDLLKASKENRNRLTCIIKMILNMWWKKKILTRFIFYFCGRREEIFRNMNDMSDLAYVCAFMCMTKCSAVLSKRSMSGRLKKWCDETKKKLHRHLVKSILSQRDQVSFNHFLAKYKTHSIRQKCKQA